MRGGEEGREGGRRGKGGTEGRERRGRGGGLVTGSKCVDKPQAKEAYKKGGSPGYCGGLVETLKSQVLLR